MLKKSFRLRKKEDFDKVFRSGKTLFLREIGCRYLAGTRPVRLGFSLSAKYLPTAVARNRLRRVLSGAFFERRAEWPETGDIVFFAAKKFPGISMDEARSLVSALMEDLPQKPKNKAYDADI